MPDDTFDLLPDDFPAAWAREWGEDDAGLWMTMAYKGVPSLLSVEIIEQIQLVRNSGSFTCGLRSSKQLRQKGFLELGKAQDLQDCVEIRVDMEALLDDGYENINGDGNPDLALDRVLGGPEERLDAQVLLDPLEEQLDLPTVSVQVGHCLRWNGEAVGQEVEGLAGLGIVVLDPT